MNLPENSPAGSEKHYPKINAGYQQIFQPGKLTIGLVAPITHYPVGDFPDMTDQLTKVKLIEALGFSAIWLRDVPFHVPNFGDVGQIYDPFAYLGYLAAHTTHLTLGIASLILPLRHPAHIAKQAATIDHLSKGRLVLGVASGDRAEEYPAMQKSYPDRGTNFQESFDYIRQINESWPEFANAYGSLNRQIDLLPKAYGSHLPLLVTGGSQQNQDWIAKHSDGWILYPRSTPAQARMIQKWQYLTQSAGRGLQPIMEPLHIDLMADPDYPPSPIHLGFRLGINPLREYLAQRQQIGVNHIALNLRFNQADITASLTRISEEILPFFSTGI